MIAYISRLKLCLLILPTFLVIQDSRGQFISESASGINSKKEIHLAESTNNQLDQTHKAQPSMDSKPIMDSQSYNDSAFASINILKSNLDVFQKNKKTSLLMMLGGAIFTGIGVAWYQNQVVKYDGNTSGGTAFMAIGGTVQLAGSVMFIDSFRWITTQPRHKRHLNSILK